MTCLRRQPMAPELQPSHRCAPGPPAHLTLVRQIAGVDVKQSLIPAVAGDVFPASAASCVQPGPWHDLVIRTEHNDRPLLRPWGSCGSWGSGAAVLIARDAGSAGLCRLTTGVIGTESYTGDG